MSHTTPVARRLVDNGTDHELKEQGRGRGSKRKRRHLQRLRNGWTCAQAAVTNGNMVQIPRWVGSLITTTLAAAWTCSCGGHHSRTPSNPRCAASDSNTPLIVAWSDRSEIHSAIKNGPVAVRYVGCELEVIDRCRVKRSDPTVYVSSAPQRSTDRISSEQLYRRMPEEAPQMEQPR